MKDRHPIFARWNNSSSTRIRGLALIVAVAVFGAPPSIRADASNISAADAIHFVGKTARVCGSVASAKYAFNADGQPTFLDLDKPYPNHVFTAVVWGKDRKTFPYAPETLAGRQICVSGRIALYREKAEITVSGPDQIRAAN